ncbi:MAG: DUF4136 domain-containing protein [Pseudomonadota bacterium]
MLKPSALCFVGFCAFLTGCSSQPLVFVDQSDSNNFAAYRTFRWLSDEPMIVSGGQALNPVEATRVQRLIEKAFLDRGFLLLPRADNVDFLVSFTVGTRDQVELQVREYLDYSGPRWSWGDEYFGFERAEYSTSVENTLVQYAVGTLAIDVYDYDRREPVWHARSSKQLKPAELQEGSAKGVEKVVEVMVTQFPSG